MPATHPSPFIKQWIELPTEHMPATHPSPFIKQWIELPMEHMPVKSHSPALISIEHVRVSGVTT